MIIGGVSKTPPLSSMSRHSAELTHKCFWLCSANKDRMTIIDLSHRMLACLLPGMNHIIIKMTL